MHIDDLVLRIRRLSMAQRKKLEEVVRSLENSPPTAIPVTAEAPRAVRGLLRDLGPAPSDDEIDRARRELWEDFPREPLP
jgi:hypothetical protein